MTFPSIITCLSTEFFVISDTPAGIGAMKSASGQFIAAGLETLSNVADRIYFLVDAEKLLQSTEANVFTPDTLELCYLLTGWLPNKPHLPSAICFQIT